MKILKYIGNRYLFISLYLLLLFEGDHFGAFYIVYLFMALPHGANYAIISAAGIILLAISGNSKYVWLNMTLLTLAVAVMIAGVVTFIRWETTKQTFYLTIPLITFILCSISGSAMIIFNFFGYYNKHRN